MKFLGRGAYANFRNQIKFSKNALYLRMIDEEDFYDEFLPKSQRLQKAIVDNLEEFPQVERLTMDLFYALYQYNPFVVEFNQMDSEYLLNYATITTVRESSKYKELRGMTVHDELSSLIATEVLLEEAIEIMKELKDKAKEAQEAVDQARQEIKDAEEAEEGEEGLSEDQLSLEDAKKKLEESREQLEEMYKKKAKRRLDKKIDLGKKEAQGIQDSIANWGLGHDESYQNMSYEEKVKMIDRLKNNEKLKRISMLTGKLKDLMFKGKETKSKRARSYLEGVNQGNSLSRVLPSELIRFAMPQTRSHFLKDFRDKKLLQNNYSGKKKLGMGPIVALIDNSGSMGGEPEIYAKAMCLTLLEMARKQRRSFLAVHFDSGQAPEDLHCNRFLKKKPYNIKEVIDLAEYFGGGGTEFEPPLKRARMEIDEEKEFTKADIIMITDGCAPIGDRFKKEFQEWKKKRKVSVFSILIDSYWGSDTSLNEFSDKTVKIEDLSKEGFDTASRLFTHLL